MCRKHFSDRNDCDKESFSPKFWFSCTCTLVGRKVLAHVSSWEVSQLVGCGDVESDSSEEAGEVYGCAGREIRERRYSESRGGIVSSVVGGGVFAGDCKAEGCSMLAEAEGGGTWNDGSAGTGGSNKVLRAVGGGLWVGRVGVRWLA